MQGHRKTGFTIVELLIVIVVIAILAAITIVAYTGIQERAQSSSAQSAASQAAKKIAAYAVEHSDTYPNAITDVGLDANDYQYSSNGSSYCLATTIGGETYFQTSTWPSPTRGTCYGLIAWYPFNGNTNDYSGYGHNEVNSQGLSSATGESGQANGAYNFNGTTSRINATYTTALNIARPGMTMSAWVNIETIGSSTRAILSRNSPYLLWIEPDNSLRSGLSAGGSWYWSSTAPGTLPLNQWIFVTVTYDGTTRNTYLNGAHVTTDTSLTGNIITNTIALNIGYDACCGSRYYFDGSMDDIRLYNRALSDQEVGQLYEAGAL